MCLKIPYKNIMYKRTEKGLKCFKCHHQAKNIGKVTLGKTLSNIYEFIFFYNFSYVNVCFFFFSFIILLIFATKKIYFVGYGWSYQLALGSLTLLFFFLFYFLFVFPNFHTINFILFFIVNWCYFPIYSLQVTRFQGTIWKKNAAK